MPLLLAFVQFAFAGAFWALARPLESGVFILFGIFFVASFFGIPDRPAGKPAHGEPAPEEPSDPLTADKVSFFARSWSYWVSSALFYASLFGISYAASGHFPEIPLATSYGAALSAVSAVLLGLFFALRKKGVRQVFLVFRINALLLSGVSMAMMLWSSVSPLGTNPYVLYSHALLAAASLAAALLADPDAGPGFRRFVLGWSGAFAWAACTHFVSLLWSGWASVTACAAASGMALFWFDRYAPKAPASWAPVTRTAGAALALCAQVSAAAAVAADASPAWVFFPLALGLAVFHGWLHREFRNWIGFVAAGLAVAACYSWAVSGFAFSHGFAVLALCALGLPAIMTAISASAGLVPSDDWFLHYLSLAVLGGYALAGVPAEGYGAMEWSAFALAASVVWYAGWTVASRK